MATVATKEVMAYRMQAEELGNGFRAPTSLYLDATAVLHGTATEQVSREMKYLVAKLAIVQQARAHGKIRTMKIDEGIRLAGKYSDPAHPGCTRKVTTIGTNKVLIEGADEDGKPWKVRGTYEGKEVTIDFTPKGGPKDVTATYTIAGGLTFPDGNKWKKL